MKAWMEEFSEEGSFEWLSRLKQGFQVGESNWGTLDQNIKSQHFFSSLYNMSLKYKNIKIKNILSISSAVIFISTDQTFFFSSVLLPRC